MKQVYGTVCLVWFGFFWLCHAARGILVPQPGIEPGLPAVKARSPNQWAAREFPIWDCYDLNDFVPPNSYVEILTPK